SDFGRRATGQAADNRGLPRLDLAEQPDHGGELACFGGDLLLRSAIRGGRRPDRRPHPRHRTRQAPTQGLLCRLRIQTKALLSSYAHLSSLPIILIAWRISALGASWWQRGVRMQVGDKT